MSKRGTFALGLFALALGVVSPIAAMATPGPTEGAQPSAAELATARKLFGEALDAEDQGRFSDALALYGRVEAIIVSPQLYYHMGLCHERLGHVVDALNAFEIAAQQAEQKGKADIARESSKHAEALREKTAKLTITAPEGVEDLELRLDDKPVRAALVGTSMLVDPGERRVSARAGNYQRRFEAVVRARPGESLTVRLDLGNKKPAAPVPPPRHGAGGEAPDAATLPPPDAPSRTPFFIAGGATAALGIGALVTGLIAHETYTDYIVANEHPEPGSLAERQSLRDSGVAMATASTVLTGAALVGAGVTLYLFFPAPHPANTKKRPQALVSPWLGPRGAGLVVEGAL